MIRPATPADIPAIVALGRLMAQEAPRWREMPYDEAKVAGVAAASVAVGGAFLAERTVFGDGPHVAQVGALVGMVAEHWFTSVRYAGAVALYVVPSARGTRAFIGLLCAFETWAATQGCDECIVGAHTGAGPAGDLFARLGYGPAGVNLVKPIL